MPLHILLNGYLSNEIFPVAELAEAHILHNAMSLRQAQGAAVLSRSLNLSCTSVSKWPVAEPVEAYIVHNLISLRQAQGAAPPPRSLPTCGSGIRWLYELACYML